MVRRAAPQQPKELGQALEQAPQIPSLIKSIQTEWMQADNYKEQFNRYEFSTFYGNPTHMYQETGRNLRLRRLGENVLGTIGTYNDLESNATRMSIVWEDLQKSDTKKKIMKLTSLNMTAEEYLMCAYVGGLHLGLEIKKSWPGINEKNLVQVLTFIKSKIDIESAKVKSTLNEGFDQQSFDLVTQHIDQKTHYWELMADLCCRAAGDVSMTQEEILPILQDAGIIPVTSQAS